MNRRIGAKRPRLGAGVELVQEWVKCLNRVTIEEAIG